MPLRSSFYAVGTGAGGGSRQSQSLLEIGGDDPDEPPLPLIRGGINLLANRKPSPTLRKVLEVVDFALSLQESGRSRIGQECITKFPETLGRRTSFQPGRWKEKVDIFRLRELPDKYLDKKIPPTWWKEKHKLKVAGRSNEYCFPMELQKEVGSTVFSTLLRLRDI